MKQNKSRRFSGGGRADRKATKIGQAEARKEAYDALTTQQKIDRLPIGGANKQRAKLLAKLEEENNGQRKG